MDRELKQRIWELYKDEYSTEGFQLENIFEIDLPFWKCKQKVAFETEREIDRFSMVILKLVDNGITEYSKICSFLGIDSNSFLNMQFNFLIKNELLKENGESYEITFEGRKFMEKKHKIKQIGIEDLEFYINDLSGEFFDPSKPIDRDWSSDKTKKFPGYDLIQSNQRKISNEIVDIQHSDKPSYSDLTEARSEFAIFYHTRFPEKTFYDFVNSDFKAYQRHIRFMILRFRNKEQQDEVIYDIRQYHKTIKKFTGKLLKEESLSKLINKILAFDKAA